jgi:histidyl-tRNA synthetase
VGFALGIDRIMLALGEPQRPHLDAYLVSETGPEEALRVASALRDEGIRVDFDVDGRSVKAQFRTARRLEVPVILVWKGEGRPVDVQTEGQRAELPLREVSTWFSSR